MDRKLICECEKGLAITAIDETEEVYFRRSVWKNWGLRNTEDVKDWIRNNETGATVFEENGDFYVTLPFSNETL